VDVRVASLPSVRGEKIVLRLLTHGMVQASLEELGLSPEALRVYRDVFTRPYGAVVVTGPTGSGKSTTLYTTLGELNDEERNIVTIEDPVEYRIEGITQIQINPPAGLTFASGLRHILRGDPDVVMVGEIRDHETAELFVEAALTGHMVLTI
jgi:type IV pilus assembly protein PilB